MFVAGIAAFLAVLIAFSINDKRKSMLAATSEPEKAPKETALKPAAKAKTAEPKNVGTLNTLLYLGCFLVVASMVGFVSYVDDTLVAPIVLIITLLAFITSWILRLKVPFLKTTSLAFNISGLAMFIFWFPALVELGFEGHILPTSIFFMMLVMSVVSAKVFKNQGLWFVSAISLVPLVFSAGYLTSEIFESIDYYEEVALYIIPVAYMVLAVIARYLWRSESSLVRPEAKSAVAVASFAYAILGSIFGISALVSELVPFAASLTAMLLIVFFYVDHSLADKSLTTARFAAQLLLFTLCFDLLVVLEADAETSYYLLFAAALLSTLVQSAISIFYMIKRPTEKAHRAERILLALSTLTLFAIAAIGSILSIEIDSARFFSSTSASNLTTFLFVVKTLAMAFAVINCAISIFVDRNTLMVIPGALFLSSIVCNDSFENLFSAIIIGVMSLVAAFSYFAIKPADEKNAMSSSLVASVSLSVISFFFCLMEGSGYWIPISIASVILLIFGYTSKRLNIIDWGYYIGAFGLALVLADVSSSLDDTSISNALEYISFLLIPASLILRDFMRSRVKDGVEPIHIRYIIGALLIWLITAMYVVFANTSRFSPDEDFLSLVCVCISVLCRLVVLLYAIRLRIKIMEILSAIFLVRIILSVVGYNIWICLLVAGLALIGFAIFAISRASKKTIAANTEIQVEKVENPDKKTLA